MVTQGMCEMFQHFKFRLIFAACREVIHMLVYAMLSAGRLLTPEIMKAPSHAKPALG